MITVLGLLFATPDGIEQVKALVLTLDELREPVEGAVVEDLPPFCFLYHAVDSDEQMAYPLQLVFSALLVAKAPNEKTNRSTDNIAYDGRDDGICHCRFL
jgi:hypothetical protein